MKVSFVKLSPTRNTTILVRDRFPREDHARIANALMDPACVGAEQAGFIEPADGCDGKLRMMGGEFCGNATMAFGALIARERGLERADLRLEISGAESYVPCRIERLGEDHYRGTVDMPLPERIFDWNGHCCVSFDGITHVIVGRDLMTREKAEEKIALWCEALGADALGILLWDAAAGAIEPLVYVPAAGTRVWEQGCGSGTSAVGCMLAAQARADITQEVRQPGGAIAVHAGYTSGKISALRITGEIRITAEGTAYIDPFLR